VRMDVLCRAVHRCAVLCCAVRAGCPGPSGAAGHEALGAGLWRGQLAEVQYLYTGIMHCMPRPELGREAVGEAKRTRRGPMKGADSQHFTPLAPLGPSSAAFC
jgi:hypothetical protein